MKTDSRRQFLTRSTLMAGSSLAALRSLEHSAFAESSPATDICVFNKPLQHLDYEAQAKLVAEMGFVGIEGTVRKGGHVLPEKVKEDLPKQIKALKEHGLEMTVMTTDVDNIDSPIHRTVLETAAELGVQRFRMGGIKYHYDRPIPEQLEEIRNSLQKLNKFCKPLGIQPLYQNHAGAGRFGAALWDLYEVLKDFDPADLGVAFDIRHATVEGGQSWPTEFHLLRPWFGTVYCKDFVWKDGVARPTNVPLGTGRVDYPAFIKMLHKSDYNGPISLHMEYKDHRDPALLEDSIAAIRADKTSLGELLGGA